MAVNKIIKVALFLALFALEANAKLIGSIGFVSPNYPDFGHYRPSQDVSDFFDEFIETAHLSYSDAGVAVTNRLNMRRGEVIYNDVEYDGVLMIPSDENREYIEKFYRKNSIRFLKKIAEANHIDILLYSSFNKTKLKRILKKKASSTLVYRIFAYDVQSGSKKSKYIKIDITDLFDSPDYDPEQLQSLFVENYIKIFQELLGHMKIIGSQYTEESASSENEKVSDSDSDSDASSSSAPQNDSNGDW
jgi:hypothetical protein